MMHDAERKDTVSPYVIGVIDKSADLLDAVFHHAHTESSLTHSDYNAWNMMVDPSTYRLTGVIDPIDAGWADWEVDLFHLPNSRPELGMLERYLRDVKHYLRMGWYKEERFAMYAQELNCYIDRCL
jgi:aminoglycoside phosphotransferase (APT) family kinase protein